MNRPEEINARSCNLALSDEACKNRTWIDTEGGRKDRIRLTVYSCRWVGEA